MKVRAILENIDALLHELSAIPYFLKKLKHSQSKDISLKNPNSNEFVRYRFPSATHTQNDVWVRKTNTKLIQFVQNRRDKYQELQNNQMELETNDSHELTSKIYGLYEQLRKLQSTGDVYVWSKAANSNDQVRKPEEVKNNRDQFVVLRPFKVHEERMEYDDDVDHFYIYVRKSRPDLLQQVQSITQQIEVTQVRQIKLAQKEYTK